MSVQSKAEENGKKQQIEVIGTIVLGAVLSLSRKI